jgi:DNA-binding transcriptional regulator YdaS (Cro superfamily)
MLDGTGKKCFHAAMTDEEAIEQVKRELGGNRGVAEALGIKPQAVSQWKRIPLSRVRQVATLTGIPASELRPDVAWAMSGEAA